MSGNLKHCECERDGEFQTEPDGFATADADGVMKPFRFPRNRACSRVHVALRGNIAGILSVHRPRAAAYGICALTAALNQVYV
jgi:hypothetical protein